MPALHSHARPMFPLGLGHALLRPLWPHLFNLLLHLVIGGRVELPRLCAILAWLLWLLLVYLQPRPRSTCREEHQQLGLALDARGAVRLMLARL